MWKAGTCKRSDRSELIQCYTPHPEKYHVLLLVWTHRKKKEKERKIWKKKIIRSRRHLEEGSSGRGHNSISVVNTGFSRRVSTQEGTTQMGESIHPTSDTLADWTHWMVYHTRGALDSLCYEVYLSRETDCLHLYLHINFAHNSKGQHALLTTLRYPCSHLNGWSQKQELGPGLPGDHKSSTPIT